MIFISHSHKDSSLAVKIKEYLEAMKIESYLDLLDTNLSLIKNKNIISLGSDVKNNILYASSGGYDGEKGFFENIPCLY